MNQGDVLFKLTIPRLGVRFITENITSHAHWRTVRGLETKWKELALVHAAIAGIHNNPGWPPTRIESTFCFTTNRRRDPANFISTIKPIVDYLTKQLHCWPDDNADWVDIIFPPRMIIVPHGIEGVILDGTVR